MCGRYRLSRRKQIVEEYFDCASDEQDWVPRYNIAPTQPVPVVRQNATKPDRELSLMRWGLIPSWAKDASGAASMINARFASSLCMHQWKLQQVWIVDKSPYHSLRANAWSQEYPRSVDDTTVRRSQGSTQPCN